MLVEYLKKALMLGFYSKLRVKKSDYSGRNRSLNFESSPTQLFECFACLRQTLVCLKIPLRLLVERSDQAEKEPVHLDWLVVKWLAEYPKCR